MSLDEVSSFESPALLTSNQLQSCGVRYPHPTRASSNVHVTKPHSASIAKQPGLKRSPRSVSAATAVMEYPKGGDAESSLRWTYQAPEWLKQAVGLLEVAVRQLHFWEAALSTLVQAASLLRKHITPPLHEAPRDVGGQLLAWQARDVLAYIDSHITDRVLVADLSATVHCSSAHFSRLFRRTFDQSPAAFVLRRRVELATRWMLDTEISLSDIALSCGFTDQPHFTNRFRRLMQETPAAWRRAHKSHQARSAIEQYVRE
jgi:AraC family transcriptional regulator